MEYAVLIIRGAQAEAEEIQTALGNSFAWLSIPPDWYEIEDKLGENPIKVVVIAGGERDLVYDCVRYAESAKPGTSIFVVSATPWLLVTLVRQLPEVTFFDRSTTMKDTSGFFGFDLFVTHIRANL